MNWSETRSIIVTDAMSATLKNIAQTLLDMEIWNNAVCMPCPVDVSCHQKDAAPHQEPGQQYDDLYANGHG